MNDPNPPIEELRNRALELGVAHDDATSPDDLVTAIAEAEEARAAAADAGPEDTRTLVELRARAGELNIDGRSKLDRDGLIAAIADAETAGGDTQPSTPDEVGRPELVEVAEQAAAEEAARTRVIGIDPNAPQED